MRVPFVDLAVHDPAERTELLAAMEEVMAGGDYVLGSAVERFERDFARYCAAPSAVGVSSGTAALVLALRALEIGDGDEVITVANSFVATVSAILLVGARPVLVDVTDDENIDVDAVEAAITPRTRAIVPVHLRGRPADMPALMRLARAHRLRVVEDASQAQGARLRGRHAGTFGDLGCFSLHPLKNLPALGDAGVILTADRDLDHRLRLLRNHGLAGRGMAVVVGDNARLDSLQAAVLRVRLRLLDERNVRRRRIATAYDRAFADLPVVLPPRTAGVAAVYHHYVIRVEDRDALLSSLHASGVDARVHYEVPAHRQAAFAGRVTVHGDLPRTTAQSGRILSLPCHPAMTDTQVAAVVAAVRGHYRATSQPRVRSSKSSPPPSPIDGSRE